jgi:hypothetical protein
MRNFVHHLKIHFRSFQYVPSFVIPPKMYKSFPVINIANSMSLERPHDPSDTHPASFKHQSHAYVHVSNVTHVYVHVVQSLNTWASLKCVHVTKYVYICTAGIMTHELTDLFMRSTVACAFSVNLSKDFNEYSALCLQSSSSQTVR